MEARNPSPIREPSATDPRLATGATWGSFQIRALVGRGSFGEVYRAWDPGLQREIALKILLRQTDDDAAYDELLREARAVASVRHANIVPIYGVDRHDGLVGFWTDFVHGKTLAALVREQGPFGSHEAALIGLDLLKAVSAVHRAGLLHRDIKAENVMREAGGRILLMDFGLSALPHRQRTTAGTPRYMAPELFAGAPATVSSDIYALGVLLFFLVAGQFPPLDSDGVLLPPRQPGNDEPTLAASALMPRAAAPAGSSLLDFRPDIPDAFVRVVDQAMQADPQRRFPSAGAMSSALSQVLSLPAADDLASAKRRRIQGWKVRAALAVATLALTLVGATAYVRYRDSIAPFKKNAESPGLNEQYLKANALLQRYDKRQNIADATVILKDVLAQDSSFALAQVGLCRAEFLEYRATRKHGLLDQARADCNRALQLDATLAPPYITLARIDAVSGNTALAAQEAGKALQLDPRSADAYGAQSEVFDAEGRGADAIAAVQRAIDLEPDYWRWPLLLGHYYFTGGKLQDAAEQFRRAVAITPDNALALRNLGVAYLQLKQFDDARTSLEKSAQVEPTFEAYSTLAELFMTQGKFDESVAMSRKAVDLSPRNYVAWGNLGSGYLTIPGDHDQAVDAYRKAIELAEITRKDTPEDPTLLADLGGYYAFIGDSGRSLPLLRKAVALAPHDPNVLFLAGDGYEILHRRGEAIQLIVRSIALGFHQTQLEKSPELASLRSDKKFQDALRTELAKNSLDAAHK